MIFLPDGRVVFVDVPNSTAPLAPATTSLAPELNQISRELKELNRLKRQEYSESIGRELQQNLDRDKVANDKAMRDWGESLKKQQQETEARLNAPLEKSKRSQQELNNWLEDMQRSREKMQASLAADQQKHELEMAEIRLQGERERLEEERRRRDLANETPEQSARILAASIRADPKMKPIIDEYVKTMAKIEESEEAERKAAAIAEQTSKASQSTVTRFTDAVSSLWNRIFH